MCSRNSTRAGRAGRAAADRPGHPLRKDIRLHRRRRRQRIPRRQPIPAQVETEIGRAHAVIDRLEALRIPTVAVIHGFCLGGGLEVALACQMRIAIEGARFGFPEMMLGLHPGLGGTARFTRLVNPMQAMTMMLTGKTIDARRAKSLGLVDAVTRGAPCPQRREGCGVRPAEARQARPAQHAAQFRPGARPARLAHAQRGRKGRAARELSRALCADRSLGTPRRRQARDAGGGEDARSPV